MITGSSDFDLDGNQPRKAGFKNKGKSNASYALNNFERGVGIILS